MRIPMFQQRPVSSAVLAALLSGSVSGIALAADASDAEQSAADDRAATPAALEGVVVEGSYVVNDQLDTATGLGITLQETPQSVSVMTSQQIEDQDLRSLNDVINNAAGISSKAFDSSRDGFSARGFDVDNYQIDGIPVEYEGGQAGGETKTDTALYERIEIVRGATGLLTGVGNPSASINLVRKRANSDELAGFVSASASRWNTFNVTADVGNALNASGSVRGRAVAVYEEGDSYVDYLSDEKRVLYGVIDADLTPNTLLSVGASYQENEPIGSMWGGLPIFFSDGTRTDWPISASTGADWTHWSTEHKTLFANLTHHFDNGWQAKLNLNRTTSAADLELLYLFGSPDPETGLGMGAFPAAYDNEREQDDFGLRVNGFYNVFGREHELVLGYSHSEQDFIYNSASAVETPDVGNFLEWDGSYPKPEWTEKSRAEDYTTKQTGYYLATRLSIADPLKVIVGTRVAQWERKGFTWGNVPLDYGDDGVVVPYAGLLYDLTPNHTLYTSYAEIFRPQDEQDRNGNLLDPLTGKNTEIGLKSRFLNDQLHTTVTYFFTQQDNRAVTDPDFVPPEDDPTRSAYIEADGVESDGFELEVVGEIMPGWDISANYTQFDATLEDNGGDARVVNTRFPDKLLRLFTTYEWQKWTFGGGINWEGETFTEVTNPATGETEKAKQEAYSLVNLMARYAFDDQLSAQINIDNALDEEYFSQIGFFTQLAHGEPRNISVKVKYTF